MLYLKGKFQRFVQKGVQAQVQLAIPNYYSWQSYTNRKKFLVSEKKYFNAIKKQSSVSFEDSKKFNSFYLFKYIGFFRLVRIVNFDLKNSEVNSEQLNLKSSTSTSNNTSFSVGGNQQNYLSLNSQSSISMSPVKQSSNNQLVTGPNQNAAQSVPTQLQQQKQ